MSTTCGREQVWVLDALGAPWLPVAAGLAHVQPGLLTHRRGPSASGVRRQRCRAQALGATGVGGKKGSQLALLGQPGKKTPQGTGIYLRRPQALARIGIGLQLGGTIEAQGQ